MPASWFIMAIPLRILTILWWIITAREHRCWRSFLNRICVLRKKQWPTWRNCVRFSNMWKSPIAVWKKAVSVVMPMFQFVLLDRKNWGQKRKLKISTLSEVLKGLLNMKRFVRRNFWKKAGRLFRKQEHGMKKKV